MFTFTSIEVKSLGYRRICHLAVGNLVRKQPSLAVEKQGELQPTYRSQKGLFTVLRCPNAFLKTSGLHGFLKHRPSLPSSVLERFLAPCRQYQTKSKDFNKEDDDNSEAENKAANVLDDLEFQSILKDFAHDFGVTEDSSKFLEEIKQSHHESSPDQHSNFKNIIESKTATQSKENSQQHCDSFEVPPSEEIQEDSDDFFHIDQELEKPVEYDSKRGNEGVYDIDDLVAVLKEENLLNITVIQVPQLLHYADYLVLASAKSPRHCNAVVEFLIKLYKKKKNESDPFIKCAGEGTTTWKAIDMGNIVLHVFLEDTRNFYDLESLWLLDRKYDIINSKGTNPETDLMQQQLDFLNSLNPQ